MKSRGTSPMSAPHITIRVSGKLFQGHLAYLDQLVHSAVECRLWPQLNLSCLEELDRAALFYLSTVRIAISVSSLAPASSVLGSSMSGISPPLEGRFGWVRTGSRVV